MRGENRQHGPNQGRFLLVLAVACRASFPLRLLRQAETLACNYNYYHRGGFIALSTTAMQLRDGYKDIWSLPFGAYSAAPAQLLLHGSRGVGQKSRAPGSR